CAPGRAERAQGARSLSARSAHWLASVLPALLGAQSAPRVLARCRLAVLTLMPPEPPGLGHRALADIGPDGLVAVHGQQSTTVRERRYMSQTTANDTCRLTVIAPTGWAEVALPVQVPLSDLVPVLVRNADPHMADNGV